MPKRPWRSGLVLIGGALAGCAEDTATTTAEGPAVALASLPGVYAGKFPCADCPGVEARLWLRADGTFFLRQSYLGPEGDAGEPFYGLGRWRWDGQERLLVLAGGGPPRIFAVPAPDRLQMQTASELDHVLMREPVVADFSDRLTLEGEYLLDKDAPVFNECRTGLRLRVASVGDHRRLLRHYRSLTPRGRPALAIVEGHLIRREDAAGSSEMLVVERLVTVKPEARCQPSPSVEIPRAPDSQ